MIRQVLHSLKKRLKAIITYNFTAKHEIILKGFSFNILYLVYMFFHEEQLNQKVQNNLTTLIRLIILH